MNIFTLFTPLTYWVLIAMWSFILVFYLKKLTSPLVKNRLLFLLLIILAIDAFRTLFESIYFGAWYTALAGFLPKGVHAFLVRPEMVFIPKILNVVAAILVIMILLFRWLPREVAEKEYLAKLIHQHTRDVKLHNEMLQKKIQDKNLSEAELEKSESRHKIIFENSPLGMILFDAQGAMVSFNDQFVTLMGSTREKLLGFNTALHSPPKMQATIKQALAGNVAVFEDKYVSVTGEKQLYLRVVFNPVNPGQSPTEVIATLEDITQRKLIEERLQHAQKIEAIGTLSGGIAHDFNNILSPLLGFAELMKEDLPGDSPLMENVDEILGAAMRAKELVKQILIFSRQDDHHKKYIVLQSVLEDAVRLLRATIPTTIEIQQEIPSEEITVFADPIQIHQIIMNLVTNAFHAMEESGGQLKLVLDTVNLGSDLIVSQELQPGEYARLIVSDTGTGIPKKNLDKIFDPYFTTKPRGKGTGLGLSVVQGIVKTNKGAIRVYSEPGQGTDIHVYIPLFEHQLLTKNISEMLPIPGGNEHILLVDDEAAIVRMEKKALERLGYEVTARTNSVDALELFRRSPQRFDLVISDMTMPGLSGIQLIGKIKKIRTDIPVVICSGFSDQIDEEKSREIGIRGYIMKPVIQREMAVVIRRAIDND